MAGTVDVGYASGIGGDLQTAGASNQRLTSVASDGDYVGALRGMADEAGAVLVCRVLVERNGQHSHQQRCKADEGRQPGDSKTCAAARYHFLELYANTNRRE